jgi:ABC-type nickel/cobalt efflux system permease component RcnA
MRSFSDPSCLESFGKLCFAAFDGRTETSPGDGLIARGEAFSFPRSEHPMHYHSHELTLGLSFLLGILHALEPGHGKTAMLGFAVGLLPCPSALFTGLSTGAPGEAYLIVFLFAAGIALSLSVVGLLLQRFGDRLGSRFSRFSHLPWHDFRGGLIVAVGAVYTLRLVVGGG